MKKKLLWLLNAGVTEFVCDKPTISSKTITQPNNSNPISSQAHAMAQQAKTLDELNTLKTNFTQCPLHKTASHTLLGKGPIKPKIMCIIYTPNTESDKTGDSFAGESGALLTRMLKAINLSQNTETYCAYLSPWRAPGNRKLTDSEIAMLKPFVDKEISLIQPSLLILFGAELAKAFLGIDTLSKARHVWHNYQGIATRVSLSLDTIKTTTQRQQAWEDLQEIQQRLA